MLIWGRSNEAFFAEGACHILAKAFLERCPNAGYSLFGLRGSPNAVVGDVLVTTDQYVFDYNGFTPMEGFKIGIKAEFARRMPD